jgi:hypothetical protein
MILDIEVKRTHDGKKVLVKIYHSEYGTYEHLLFIDEKDRPVLKVSNQKNSNIYSILDVDDEVCYADTLEGLEKYYEDEDALMREGFVRRPIKVDTTLEKTLSLCVCDKEWLEDFQNNWQFCNHDTSISEFKFDKKPIIVRKAIGPDYINTGVCRRLTAYGDDQIDLKWLEKVKFFYPDKPIGFFISDFLKGDELLEQLELLGRIDRQPEREMERRKRILADRKIQEDLRMKANRTMQERDEFVASLYSIDYVNKMKKEIRKEVEKEIIKDWYSKYKLIPIEKLRNMKK